MFNLCLYLHSHFFQDSVLKSVARDWSREGREERSVAYDRLIRALEQYVPRDRRRGAPCREGDDAVADDDARDGVEAASDETLRPPPRVAVPGSGLGRLGWEIYARGYSVEGSDFSLPMLLASDFVLNGCGGGGGGPEEDAADAGARDDGAGAGAGAGGSWRRFGISPWLAETKNVSSFADRTRVVIVPDVDPGSLRHLSHDHDDVSAAPEFTMMAGEFLSLYSHFLPRTLPQDSPRGPRAASARAGRKFHAVVCSFFLDTAPSVPHYLHTLYHMLAPGGRLLVFGPLMYHWSGHGHLLPGDLARDGVRDAAAARSGGDDEEAGQRADRGGAYERRTAHLDDRYLSSLDYTWEEVRHMVQQSGFDIEEEETHIPARYTADATSMMKVNYDCVFMVARKRSS